MPTTDDIIKDAKALGEKLAEHDAVKKAKDALDRFEKDTDAQQVMQQFSQTLQKLAQKEASGQPIEVSEKKQLQELQASMAHNLTMRQFQMAQMDLEDLLRQVDQHVTGPATEAAGLQQPQQQAPLGSAPGANPLGGSPLDM